MGSLKVLAGMAGCLAIAASTMAARAADLLPPPPMPEPFEFDGGGWYLRGDVGVGITQFRRTDALDRSSPAQPYNYRVIEDSIGDQVSIGAGIGYQVNSWLRFDATGEYRTKADYRFSSQDVTFGNPNAFNVDTSRISAAVGLANVYFDLGTWYGLTPFVGAGVGVASLMFDHVQDVGQGSSIGGFGTAPTHDKTNLAWAVHAGVGYDVAPNLKLELAYRYLNMGDAQSGIMACLPDCGLRTVYKVRDIDSHDIKIGMRWMLGGPVAVVEPPPPLIRKY